MSLEHLNMRSNRVGSAGAKSLSDSLRFNRYLRELDLGWNAIGDVGALHLSGALHTSALQDFKDINEKVMQHPPGEKKRESIWTSCAPSSTRQCDAIMDDQRTI